ncbi:phospholipase D family protein [Variovorax sp. AFSI2.2]|uniref:phospholipase D family protein n=1 Tax=Variovorax sp. AFSI2.2 TaxID=3384160 RepID=UPI003EBF81F3
MSKIEIHCTRPFAQQFRNALAQGPRSITIVSPFLTPVKPWSSVLEFARHAISRGTDRIEIVTCPPADDAAVGQQNVIRRAEASQLEAEGVSLKIRETSLHSKLFHFEFDAPKRYTAFIGSSNFTQGGFERNDETMVRIDNPDHEAAVEKELKRLTGFGSFPFYVWQASKLTSKGKA